MTKQKKIE